MTNKEQFRCTFKHLKAFFFFFSVGGASFRVIASKN